MDAASNFPSFGWSKDNGKGGGVAVQSGSFLPVQSWSTAESFFCGFVWIGLRVGMCFGSIGFGTDSGG